MSKEPPIPVTLRDLLEEVDIALTHALGASCDPEVDEEIFKAIGGLNSARVFLRASPSPDSLAAPIPHVASKSLVDRFELEKFADDSTDKRRMWNAAFSQAIGIVRELEAMGVGNETGLKPVPDKNAPSPASVFASEISDIKPCPCCGSRGAYLLVEPSFNDTRWLIYCTFCGCNFNERVTHEEAIERWNRRYSKPVSGKQPIETAPKGIPVIVAGGLAMRKTGSEWYTGMEDPRYERALQWQPKWWMPIPTGEDL